MNYEEIIIILQTCLFSINGLSKEAIEELGGYDVDLIRIGCKLSEYLKGKEIINKSLESK